MKIKKFEDLIAWQKSRKLTKVIFIKFRTHKNFSFKDQIQRASLSIMNNIAEGFDRCSKKEFKQFLFFARASCSEVRSMLYISLDLGYISSEEYKGFNDLAEEVSKITYGLIKSLN